MSNAITENSLLDMAHLWLKEGKTFEQIQEELISMRLSTEVVEEVMKHIKDERYQAQRSKGLPMIAVGVAMCVSGCVATLGIGELSTAFHISLYGLTSLGAVTIVVGLAFILGID